MAGAFPQQTLIESTDQRYDVSLAAANAKETNQGILRKPKFISRLS